MSIDEQPMNVYWGGQKSSTSNKYKINYKGTVSTASDLPTTGNKKGDTYNISEDGSDYIWTGTEWNKFGANVYVGATNTANGIQGLVPVATSSQMYNLLTGMGTWQGAEDLGLAFNSIIATNSTTPRILADRFTDVVNVKDFGAVGDGTTDDTASLMAAFSAGGKILLERDKTYLITQHIYLEKGNIDIDLNGGTIYCSTSKLIIFAPSNTTATVYNGLQNITLRNGTLSGLSVGTAHNKHVFIDSVNFINSNNSHHIQVFTSSDVHITNCYFEGLLYTDDSAHYESINIDPGDRTAFPYFPVDSVTYDGTKNKFIYIDNCTFNRGSGNYANLDSTIGTHYDDGVSSWHENIYITNCTMTGIGKWGIRANSWKNAAIQNCVIETDKFAFDLGYQKRAKNIFFADSIIKKDYSVDPDNPIHFGPYRGDNICISNVVCIDPSGTNETLSNITLYATIQPGEEEITFSPARCSGIAPLQSGYQQIGSEDLRWGAIWTADVNIKKANPYLSFIETDVERGVAPSSTGYQGIYFKDKNKTTLGSIVFRVQKDSSNKPYNTLHISHGGNTTSDSTHSLRLRQNSGGTWSFSPEPTNSVSLGASDYIWSEVYAGNATIQTSDERLKDNFASVPEAVMKAWSKVNFIVFQFKDAIEKKGDNARLHVGVIAQKVAEAFASEGIDASRFGLFCYDEWDDEYEDIKVVDAEAVLDENGTVVEPEQSHVERKLVQKAGSQFGIRYGEALALECAYQRWLRDQRDAEIVALKERLARLEAGDLE